MTLQWMHWKKPTQNMICKGNFNWIYDNKNFFYPDTACNLFVMIISYHDLWIENEKSKRKCAKNSDLPDPDNPYLKIWGYA